MLLILINGGNPKQECLIQIISRYLIIRTPRQRLRQVVGMEPLLQ